MLPLYGIIIHLRLCFGLVNEMVTTILSRKIKRRVKIDIICLFGTLGLHKKIESMRCKIESDAKRLVFFWMGQHTFMDLPWQLIVRSALFSLSKKWDQKKTENGTGFLENLHAFNANEPHDGLGAKTATCLIENWYWCWVLSNWTMQSLWRIKCSYTWMYIEIETQRN